MGTATLLGHAVNSGTVTVGPVTSTAGSTIVLVANHDAGAGAVFSHNKAGSITNARNSCSVIRRPQRKRHNAVMDVGSCSDCWQCHHCQGCWVGQSDRANSFVR